MSGGVEPQTSADVEVIGQWLEALGLISADEETGSLPEILSDGTVLCRLANRIKPRSVENVSLLLGRWCAWLCILLVGHMERFGPIVGQYRVCSLHLSNGPCICARRKMSSPRGDSLPNPSWSIQPMSIMSIHLSSSFHQCRVLSVCAHHTFV